MGARWRVIGTSVRGAAHVTEGLPNQDALLLHAGEVVAVADGHGARRCLRSHVGARLAVEAVERAWQAFLEDAARQPAASLKRRAEEGLPQEVVRRWRDAVAADVLRRPLTEAELQGLPGGEAERRGLVLTPCLAYGTTLVAALLGPTFLVYVQVGDGDIVLVSEDLQVGRPLPPDARLAMSETTSLAADEAWRDFRVGFQPLEGAPPPALIMVATDGFSNSYGADEDFLRVGSHLLEVARTRGLEAVERDLAEDLARVSEHGSGDDVTVGIAARVDALERAPAGRS